MSVAAQAQRPRVDVIPDVIESPRAKLVYLSLVADGRASADELTERLDMQKLTLFPVLETLEGRGLVASDGGVYGTA